ncbi:hypothetical protein [Rhodoblastus sp.]|jgi:hypothetical protein|uniref:hypothetical protein n=1 Tax=Rhodoblastus sp. TaxID=1962975 RepID=UPI0025F680B7|nr:hypothetical protein [Rhodoblastus sp.]
MKSRRFGLYFAWSRPREIGANLHVLDNRYPTLFEFRRILWPEFEQLRDPARFPQGIEGFLDHVILSDFQHFQRVIREATGNEVVLIQREGDKPPTGHLDERLLADIDTLIVVSLDHVRAPASGGRQEAAPGEIELVRHFLSDESHCLVLCPHHDIGGTALVPGENALRSQEIEYRHHGDPTIPPQQRFGAFCLSLARGLGLPFANLYGLNPATAPDGSPAPLETRADLDRNGLLRGVRTFNLHPHLPHLSLPGMDETMDVLALQTINPAAAPHPFVQAGHKSFNALLQARPNMFAGTLLVCDATIWSAAFQGLESLETFWRNLAALRK